MTHTIFNNTSPLCLMDLELAAELKAHHKAGWRIEIFRLYSLKWEALTKPTFNQGTIYRAVKPAKSETPKLLPCPFCGVTDVSCVPAEDDPDYDADYDVVAGCMSCGSRGPANEYKNGIAAIAAWNRRADVSAAQIADLTRLRVIADAYEELLATVKGECPSLINEDSGGSSVLVNLIIKAEGA